MFRSLLSLAVLEHRVNTTRRARRYTSRAEIGEDRPADSDKMFLTARFGCDK